MRFSEFLTGEKVDRDDLISFLNHTLKESEFCAQYLKDAEEGGDQALVEFFKEVQAQDRLRAWRAKQLLEHWFAT